MSNPVTSLPPPPGAWPPAQRAAQALASPIQRFLAVQASSGLMLLIAIVVAMAWANSPAATAYHALWHLPVSVEIGGISFEKPLHFFVNEGLMTLFFFVVGLEIRRELAEGELASARQAALPLVAALGGVTIPALIFMIFNQGREGSAGWAIPMATDIAFAVGVLMLLGSRTPGALRVLLLALAVVDDVVAILIIAVFFSAGTTGVGFVIVAGGLAIVIVLRAMGIRRPMIYALPGIVVWYGLYRAGIHPTLAGVALGMLTPVRPWFGPSAFKETTEAHLHGLDATDREELLGRLDDINLARREAVSPVEYLIHVLHPWVAFGVMPLFALANAGVSIGAGELSGDGLWLFAGIVVALAIGKPLGIAGAVLLSLRLGITRASAGLRPDGIVLVGVVGGIGFTMSLFIAQLAFVGGPLLETAKLAILVGSALAMIAGIVLGLVLRARNHTATTR